MQKCLICQQKKGYLGDKLSDQMRLMPGIGKTNQQEVKLEAYANFGCRMRNGLIASRSSLFKVATSIVRDYEELRTILFDNNALDNTLSRCSLLSLLGSHVNLDKPDKPSSDTFYFLLSASLAHRFTALNIHSLTTTSSTNRISTVCRLLFQRTSNCISCVGNGGKPHDIGTPTTYTPRPW